LTIFSHSETSIVCSLRLAVTDDSKQQLPFAIVDNTMKRKVWVTWKTVENPRLLTDRVELDEDAIVVDLRNTFKTDRGLVSVDPATLIVSTADGTELKSSEELRKYFIALPNSAAQPGPGRSDETALVVTVPPLQQNSK
jgi:hypothetical protein